MNIEESWNWKILKWDHDTTWQIVCFRTLQILHRPNIQTKFEMRAWLMAKLETFNMDILVCKTSLSRATFCSWNQKIAIKIYAKFMEIFFRFECTTDWKNVCRDKLMPFSVYFQNRKLQILRYRFYSAILLESSWRKFWWWLIRQLMILLDKNYFETMKKLSLVAQ